MGPARAGVVRNGLGSLAVVAVVATIAVGLPILDRGMPAGRPLVVGASYDVGAEVTLVPPDGAWVDVSRTRPGRDRGSALFVVSGVRLAVVVGPYNGSLAEAAERLRGKITKTTGFQVAGAVRSVRTDQGVAGLRGTYSSPGRLGEYAVFVRGRQAVEVTLSGPADQLRDLGEVLEASVASVAFPGGR